jgi:hypothetical protein
LIGRQRGEHVRQSARLGFIDAPIAGKGPPRRPGHRQDLHQQVSQGILVDAPRACLEVGFMWGCGGYGVS